MITPTRALLLVAALISEVSVAENAVDVKYTYQRSGNTLTIHASNPYIDLLNTGGNVPVNVDFRWHYPRFAVTVVNDRNGPVVFTEAVFRVRTSVVNSEPLPIVQEEGVPDSIFIQNIGWGNLSDITVSYVIRRDGHCTEPYVGERHRLQRIDHITDFFMLKVTDAVPSALREEEYGCAVAALSYRTPSKKAKRINFNARVYLGKGAVAPPLRPSAFYGVWLPAGKNDYIKRIPLAQTVPSKTSDAFEITVGTDKSAKFDFDMWFTSADGHEHAKTTVQLDIFVPRGRLPDGIHDSVPKSVSVTNKK